MQPSIFEHILAINPFLKKNLNNYITYIVYYILSSNTCICIRYIQSNNIFSLALVLVHVNCRALRYSWIQPKNSIFILKRCIFNKALYKKKCILDILHI